MKTNHTQRVIGITVLSLLACGLWLTAVEPMPDVKVIIVPTMLPKQTGNTTTPPDAPPGYIRAAHENFYENYFKQKSYFRYDPNTGDKLHGYSVDTKTFNYVNFPWPLASTTAQNSFTNGMPSNIDKFESSEEDRPLLGFHPYRPTGLGEVNLEAPNAVYQSLRDFQLFTGTNDNPLADGVWTPGEAFHDVNANGQRDDIIFWEPWWNASNNNFQQINDCGYQLIIDGAYYSRLGTNYDRYRGEIYADYNLNTSLKNAYIGFETNVTLFIKADNESNRVVQINEFDLTPPWLSAAQGGDDCDSREGDFYHAAAFENRYGFPSGQTNDYLPNGLFDYNTYSNGPLVYRAFYQGSSINDRITNLFYQVWAHDGDLSTPYMGNDAVNATNVELITVTVPLYQAGEIFGRPIRTNATTVEWTDTIVYGERRRTQNTPNGQVLQRPDGDDGEWDTGYDPEPFEDFLSWWNPYDEEFIYISQAHVEYETIKLDFGPIETTNSDWQSVSLFGSGITINSLTNSTGGVSALTLDIVSGFDGTDTNGVYQDIITNFWGTIVTNGAGDVITNGTYEVVTNTGPYPATVQQDSFTMNQGTYSLFRFQNVPPSQTVYITVFASHDGSVYPAEDYTPITVVAAQNQDPDREISNDVQVLYWDDNIQETMSVQGWTEAGDLYIDVFPNLVDGQAFINSMIIETAIAGTGTNLNRKWKRPDRRGEIDWRSYTNYINNNYPGDVVSLLARAGNGAYDGPDNWAEKGNYKYRQNDYDPLLSVPLPFWDPHGWFGYNYNTWWMAWFGQAGPLGSYANPYTGKGYWSENTYYESMVPIVSEIDPEDQTKIEYATTSYVDQITGELITEDVGRWIPDVGDVWAYDSPREFWDLPSSIYFLAPYSTNSYIISPPSMDVLQTLCSFGGDGRLGEITDPQSDSLIGTDNGPNVPGDPTTFDYYIGSAGPLSYNLHGDYGYDAGIQLGIEMATRCTSGGHNTGPQTRDTNLDGMIDQGESRKGAANYRQDQDWLTVDTGDYRPGGGASLYPYNCQRMAASAVMLTDEIQDYTEISTNGDWLYFAVIHEGANDGLGLFAGPTFASWTRDISDRPINYMFQIYDSGRIGESWGGDPSDQIGEDPGDPSGLSSYEEAADFAGYGMGYLVHENGHEFFGWPDLYDYDVWEGILENAPIGGFDIMAGGPINFGIPDLRSRWTAPQNLKNLLVQGGGQVTVEMYPTEIFKNNYYYFSRGDISSERFWFWYEDSSALYSTPGGRGIRVSHTASGYWDGNEYPIQQRAGDHYTWEMVQADGLNELQDGGQADSGDIFPGSTDKRVFSADTYPASRWWDQQDSGIRIVNIEIPDNEGDPAMVTFEWTDPVAPWTWPESGADTDGDLIPDVWEYHYFGRLDIVSTSTDYDGDGLLDYDEYLSHSDPTYAFSAQTAGGDTSETTYDGDYDTDGDNIPNNAERLDYGTHPYLPDTDDDGLEDGTELFGMTSPIDALDPDTPRAVRLDGGATNYVEMPIDNDRFSLSKFTVGAWIHPYSIDTDSEVISRPVMNGVYNYDLGWNDSGWPAAKFTKSGTTDVVFEVFNNAQIPTNQWTHYAVSFDGSYLRLWINGSNVNYTATYGSRPQTIDPSAAFQISCKAGRNFEGKMDDVFVYNRALSGSEMSDMMNGSPPASGLQCLYVFDDRTNPDGTSGDPAWTWGQVQDFAVANNDWMVGWENAGTLIGGSGIGITMENPGVEQVTTPSIEDNGVYLPVSTIRVWVVFSDPIEVLGVPLLEMDLNVTNYFARFVGITNNQRVMEFDFVLDECDWSWDLSYRGTNSLLRNGGIVWTVGNHDPVDLTLPVPGSVGSLSWNRDIIIDPPLDGMTVNGMEAGWLWDTFKNYNIGAMDDHDSDGMSNEDEYRTNTDPTDDTSLLAISRIVHHGDSLTITWKSAADQQYTVQSQSLSSGSGWQTVDGCAHLLNSGGDAEMSVTITDPALINEMRFFRVIVTY